MAPAIGSWRPSAWSARCIPVPAMDVAAGKTGQMAQATTEEQKTTPEPGTGHKDQAFLVGEHVYIRPIESDDAAWSTSWNDSVFPRSTSRAEKWITEDMKDEERTAFFLIVRKADDRPVGRVRVSRWAHNRFVDAYVDRLFGEQADRWTGEALQLVLPWIVDEQHRVIAHVGMIPADKPIIHEMLEAIGARQSARFREMIRRGDHWVDALDFEYPNKQWVQTLGDPADIPLERTGTGEPRPVSPPVPLDGETVPLNAMRVGERVYLRPLQRSDAKLVALWARQETEPFWNNGRSVYTVTSIQKWFESLQKEEPQEWVRFGVCLRENDELIGVVGIDGIDYQHRHAESESEINRPEYRGGGYGSEAKHLLFDYAFNTLGLHSLQSYVFYDNTRSAAALRKQGYKEAGRESWLIAVEGGYQNFVVFDLLAEDWRAMPRREIAD